MVAANPNVATALIVALLLVAVYFVAERQGWLDYWTTPAQGKQGKRSKSKAPPAKSDDDVDDLIDLINSA
jgi:hypothetical protein